MLQRNIAGRYANALFQLARDTNALDALEADFPRIAGMISSDKDLHDFLIHPAIAPAEKKNIIKSIVGDTNALLFDYLSLVVDKKREAYIPLMWDVVKDLLLEYRKQIVAEVDTPYELPADIKDALAAKLGQVTGKTVVINQVVQPELIGGVRVRFGDRVVDGSVVHRMHKLRESLKAVKV
jgi:F-type H+-transporting ATPase subunit delta